MKRSEINRILQSSDDFIRSCKFHLPPFAYWSLDTWKENGETVNQIVQSRLGWDVTDFGSGNFSRYGLVLFTLRNGIPNTAGGKPYAEKIMVVHRDQVTPLHFHLKKMEDIINRGGGRLAFRLYNSTPDEKLAGTPVSVKVDGMERALPAGEVLLLDPGESLTLPQNCYHEFWGEGGRVLVGEVSSVNDDDVDNRFLNAGGRFPAVEEDEAPLYLLCSDYRKYLL